MKPALREAGLLTYRFGPFRLIPERLLLVRDGRPVEVGPKALELLLILVEQAGQVVSKKELMERLWPDTFVEENNLAQAVSSLRQALADDSDSPQYIKTVPRRGYMFAHPVHEIWDGALAGSKKTVGPAPARIPSGALAQPRVQEQPPIGHLGSRLRLLTLRYPRVALLIAAAVFIVTALFLAFGSSAFRMHGVNTRSTIAAPPDWEFVTTGEMAGSLILSPDGANAVFGARNAKSQSMLFLRNIDSLTAEPIAGTEGAAMPFWSPDGSKIGFFASQQLKTLYLADRSVHVVCGLQNESFRGGTWETPDTILLADSTRGPILKVSARGGDANSRNEPCAITLHHPSLAPVPSRR
jgi:DNA-binding winged helix-turn-helix (wHTH) protein